MMNWFYNWWYGKLERNRRAFFPVSTQVEGIRVNSGEMLLGDVRAVGGRRVIMFVSGRYYVAHRRDVIRG